MLYTNYTYIFFIWEKNLFYVVKPFLFYSIFFFSVKHDPKCYKLSYCTFKHKNILVYDYEIFIGQLNIYGIYTIKDYSNKTLEIMTVILS